MHISDWSSDVFSSDLYRNQDFEIIAIPSNDFGKQEPRENQEIMEFCRVKYGTTFPVFSKLTIRGPDTHPLYQFLSDKKQNGKVKASPLWNFHTYLIDKDGMVADFFYLFTKPTSNRIRKRLNLLLPDSNTTKS